MSADSTSQSNSQREPRSLSDVRTDIDRLDHEILQLLAQRNDLVGEVAAYKRDHQVPIRDFSRERKIFGDRRSRAIALGLSPQIIESLFRLILWGSRDRQAELKAEVPLDLEPVSVAVIGGRGAMGSCIAKLFGDLGHEVTVADTDTTLAPERAAEVADVVVISVPMRDTVRVIRQVGPCVREDALLMDVTSVKTDPVAEMMASSRGAVIGTHPLFAPSVHSLQGQRVVLCHGRGDQWLSWLRQMFHARGLVTKEATPEVHDEAMSIVQVLVHFSTEVMGATLQKLGVPISETLAFTSPIYLIELLMTARHFAQSPDLYGAIQASNKETPRVTETFVTMARQLSHAIAADDRTSFATMFSDVQAYFGSFTDQALEQSSFLIDRLVERT